MTALIVKDHENYCLLVEVINNPRKLVRKFYDHLDMSIMMFHSVWKSSIYEACRILYQVWKFLVVPFSDIGYLLGINGEPALLTEFLVPSDDSENEFDLSNPVFKKQPVAV